MMHISIKSPLVLILAIAFSASIVGAVLLSSNQNWKAEADSYFVQSATSEATRAKFISAELRRAPSPGDLIVAVVANRVPTSLVPSDDWKLAMAGSNQSPGLSILYRVAGEKESSRVTVSGFEEYGDLALQVFEYRGLNVEVPPYVTRSAVGKGRDLGITDVQVNEGDSVAIIAAAVDGRQFIRHFEPNVFDARRETQTAGSGAMSLASGELFLPANEQTHIGASVGDITNWHIAAVLFNVTPELSIAAQEDVNSPADHLSLEVTVDDPTPKERTDITYSITVSNNGTEPVTELEIGTHLPRSVVFKSATVPSGQFLPYAHLWYLPELGAGEQAELFITAIVKPETALTTFFFKPSVLYFDQYLEGEVDIWDAASVDVKRLTFDESLALSDECPEVTHESVLLNDGDKETETNIATVFGDANNATYMLFNTRADINSAWIVPIKTSFEVDLGEAYGEKELFAWFGSDCDRTGTTSDAIAYVEALVVEEEDTEELDEDQDQNGTIKAGQQEEEPQPEADQPSSEEVSGEAGPGSAGEGDIEEPEPAVASRIPAGCAPSVPFTSYLYSGSTGSEVGRLQQTLACLGYYAGAIDGVFTQAVTTAVANVQSAYGLTVSGALNLNTRELLSGF